MYQNCVVKITQGGGVAAPIASQVLTDVLTYLEVKKDNIQNEEEKKYIVVPNIRRMSIKEAEKVLNESGLVLKADPNQSEKIILEQIPYPGIEVKQGSAVQIIIEQIFKTIFVKKKINKTLNVNIFLNI